MDVDKLAIDLLLKGMTQEQQTAALDSIKDSVAQAKAVQKQRIGENVQVVVQALKKLEADIRERYDEVGNKIEARVATIKDGKDGLNGSNGKDGKDGRPGRDGGMGPRGADGLRGLGALWPAEVLSNRRCLPRGRRCVSRWSFEIAMPMVGSRSFCPCLCFSSGAQPLISVQSRGKRRGRSCSRAFVRSSGYRLIERKCEQPQ